MSDIENQITNDVIVEGLQDNNPSMLSIIIEKMCSFCLFIILFIITEIIIIAPIYYVLHN